MKKILIVLAILAAFLVAQGIGGFLAIHVHDAPVEVTFSIVEK